MATITYLILPSVVKERTAMHENVDDKLIYPEILAAQDLYILPLLGSNLFAKIKVDIAAGTLTGEYKKLMDEFIVMAMCNYVMADTAVTLQYQLYNKGVTTKTDDNSSGVSQSEVLAAQERYKRRAEHYVDLARKYLRLNIQKFPEYDTVVAGVDLVPAEQAGFTCPIYLGDASEELPGDYSLNNYRPRDHNSNYYPHA